ncbi:gene transfer agent family protein [uncultured Paracoccus sp.]|uniref:gene transfer agent family protein n=1 Tax=uncultured Paracoccus sp. TaxID=189685 RepID=UPI0025F64A2B|nr:gene transfer agent family protein [uncultured Paracoccus sp.]
MQAVVLRWPGGEHAFRLGLGELRALQQKTDCGPEFILHKITTGRWMIDELREVLRNGLIGAGLSPVEAMKLVDRTFEDTPAISFKAPAVELLAAYLYGPEDDPVGEALAVDPTPPPEPTENGNSAPITA